MGFKENVNVLPSTCYIYSNILSEDIFKEEAIK